MPFELLSRACFTRYLIDQCDVTVAQAGGHTLQKSISEIIVELDQIDRACRDVFDIIRGKLYKAHIGRAHIVLDFNAGNGTHIPKRLIFAEHKRPDPSAHFKTVFLEKAAVVAKLAHCLFAFVGIRFILIQCQKNTLCVKSSDLLQDLFPSQFF